MSLNSQSPLLSPLVLNYDLLSSYKLLFLDMDMKDVPDLTAGVRKQGEFLLELLGLHQIISENGNKGFLILHSVLVPPRT